MSFPGVATSMTLNDLEIQKIADFQWIFRDFRILCTSHTLQLQADAIARLASISSDFLLLCFIQHRRV